MKKLCNRCRTEKSVEDFALNASKADGRQVECRLCKSARDRAYHARNPKEQYARVTRNRKRRRLDVMQQIVAFLETHPCVDCGYSDLRALDFDHVVPDKTANVGSLVREGASWERIWEEMSKCVVRCRNCHWIKTGAERGFLRHQLVEARAASINGDALRS